MSPLLLLGLAGTAGIAAFIQGAVGIGFALVMAPVMGLVRPDLLPVALLILMLPLNLHVAWRERAALDLNGAGWITAGRVAGGVLGVGVLALLSADKLSLLIGGATILAALAALCAPSFIPRPRACVAAGVVTGITETATGVGGPPLALLYQHRPPATLRATIAFCFLVGELVSLALLAASGRLGMEAVQSAAVLLPAVLVGSSASQLVHGRIGQRQLRTGVLLFSLVSGVVLIVVR
jgi:uncharacterized membrane protein YfcA